MNNKYLTAILAAILIAPTASAQSLDKNSMFYGLFGSIPVDFSLILIVIILFLLVILSLLTAVLIDFGRHARKDLAEKGEPIPFIISIFGIFDGDSKAITGENTDIIIDDHDYDGIQEFDNDLPPWWLYGFYITIIVSIGYMLHYHVFKTGELSIDEYTSELKVAELLYADVDMVYNEPLTDSRKLADAKIFFIENCATCHGDQAAGSRGGNFTAGPNLVDNYWMHGGNINDIYKTIKHGQGNGRMPEWKNKFSNDQIYQITSYIISLKGSKVDNPKEPQGELYQE